MVAICGAFAFLGREVSVQGKSSETSELWLGIGYLADGDRNESAVIGAVGLAQSTMWGYAASAAFAGPIGALVGAGVGL